MGNCAAKVCCKSQSESEFNFTNEQIFNRKSLTGGQLEIGENGYDSPLTRKALLEENYSHIYDKKFDWENRDKIARI